VTGKFTDGPCIAGVMKKAGIDQKVIDQCMEDSGGVDSAVNNQILDSELQEKVGHKPLTAQKRTEEPSRDLTQLPRSLHGACCP
jgi:hypothetical protein